MMVTPSPDETLDTFFNRRIRILQNKRGYRFSIDAILLGQFSKIRKNEKVIDLGTGCGILPLLLSHQTKAHSFVGVEIPEGLAELAKRNVLLNRLEDLISILQNDFRKLKIHLSSRILRCGSFESSLSKISYGPNEPQPGKGHCLS